MAFSSPSTDFSLMDLSQALSARASALGAGTDLQINCWARAGYLIVIGQHGAPEAEDPDQVLTGLQGLLTDLMPQWDWADSPWADSPVVPVRLYLKLKPAPRPYALRSFDWQPEATGAEMDFGDLEAPLLDAATELGLWEEGQALTAPESAGDQALALPATAIQPPQVSIWAKQGRQLAHQAGRFLRHYWGFGVAGLILLASGVFAYALTRPCVVGSCDRLVKADEFYQLAESTLRAQPQGDDLTLAQADLQAAIQMLESIPTWSAHHGAAQASLDRYQTSLLALDQVIQAQTLAAQAADLSQNPPHPVERWVNIHLLWQQAIDRLGAVPADSPAFDYAQKKLREYRVNHRAIGRRIVAEEEAEANFNTAIQTGQLAQQRMETANSLAGWQLATKEWQAAIKGLSLIPRGTMVYVEAQDQLREYQQHLQQSMNRATLEDASARNYDQALQAARAAAAYEAKSQWTLAVSHWQQAVASAQQIPRDTLLHKEAEPLLETYQPALTNAQNRLRTAVALQGLTSTLGEMCALEATPCSVREEANQVQVVLTSQYAEPLRLAITPPAADGTFAFTNQLSPNGQQLIDQIITFSHQVNRQVAIYDSRGGFVARYRPDLGGFVKN